MSEIVDVDDSIEAVVYLIRDRHVTGEVCAWTPESTTANGKGAENKLAPPGIERLRVVSGCARPQSRSYFREEARDCRTGARPGPYLVGVLVWALGLSLGGTTGYVINPARDLGPR